MRGVLLLVAILFPGAEGQSQTVLKQRIALGAGGEGCCLGVVFTAGDAARLRFECAWPSADAVGVQAALGVAVLHAVEQRQLSIDQTVRFLPADIYEGTFSPLQDLYPKANVDVPLRQLLELSVGRSDNTATDILFRLMGGTEPVQRFLDSLGLESFQVRDTERSLHDDERRQYRNFGEPAAFVKLLRMLAEASPLTAEHTKYLLEIMTESPSGPKRLKGALPAGTIVAHKTGTSGYENGMAAATNDVGLITLPDGRRLAVAVLVTDAHADEAAVEHTIAAIARACYDAAMAAGR